MTRKIITPLVTGTPPKTPINLDGFVNLGKMSLAEKLILAADVQAQARQDLVKSESKDNKIILMLVYFFQNVAPTVQVDSNNSPSDKFLQLINNVNTIFDSFEKTGTQKVLDTFKDVRIQTFWKMIEDDRVILNKRL